MKTETEKADTGRSTQAPGYPAGISRIIVRADVRYWEDAEINGVEDTKGDKVPMRSGDAWCPEINLLTGSVIGWPAGTTASIHYKVCDGGEYWLGNDIGEKLLKWRGDYVPDSFLCHGDEGYGDYIIFNIAGDGRIAGWKLPVFQAGSWQDNGQDKRTAPQGGGAA